MGEFMVYDCIVIGTGAAGVSAALALKSLKRSFLLIGEGELSHKIGRAECIKNYPGLPSVTGEQMRAAFFSQLKEEGIEITQGKVSGVFSGGGNFTVACADNAYECKTIILATGVETVKPLSGEREFLGRGVSYCAPCDAFLYRGKRVAAVLCAEEEESEIELLSRFAKEVLLFPMIKNIGKFPENVRICEGKIKGIEGGERVERIMTNYGAEEVDGVFVLKNTTSGDALIEGLELCGGAVKVDRACATNIDGVFAAGDCTGRPYQYVKAAGEGNVAAHSANACLNARKKAEKC